MDTGGGGGSAWLLASSAFSVVIGRCITPADETPAHQRYGPAPVPEIASLAVALRVRPQAAV